jgi:CDP-glycerol glycerophosphotransferase (TagB/SpsB family)
MEHMAPLIIDAILALPDVRVIYKPHPRIADAIDDQIRKNHKYVLRAIKQANAKDAQAGHQIREDGDILAIFPRVDLLISDVSSIALDFLYLRTEAPIILTDRRNDIAQLRIDSPLSAATPVLTKDSIKGAVKIIGDVLSSDSFVEDRKVLREFYFDNVQAGESAPRFYAAMRDAIAAHSADAARAKSLAESGTGPRFEHRA